jgi:hypothetical protein
MSCTKTYPKVPKFAARNENGLPHVGICCKSLDIQMLLKGSKEMEMTGREIRPVGRVVRNLPVIVP